MAFAARDLPKIGKSLQSGDNRPMSGRNPEMNAHKVMICGTPGPEWQKHAHLRQPILLDRDPLQSTSCSRSRGGFTEAASLQIAPSEFHRRPGRCRM